MFSNVTKYGIHFNSQYKSSNVNSISQLLEPVNDQHNYSLKNDKKFVKNVNVTATQSTRPLSNSNLAMNRGYNEVNKSKYILKNVKLATAHAPNGNKYKWENRNAKSENLSTVPKTQNISDTTVWNPSINRESSRQVTLSKIVENVASNHYRSCVPFYTLLSKGWFSQPPCSISCFNSTSFDLQSCCFINSQCLPPNTLRLNTVQGPIVPRKIVNTKSNSENRPAFVKLSKHKLIRKPQQETRPLKTNSSVVLCTKRKLIRESQPTSSPKKPIVVSVRDVSPMQITPKESSTDSTRFVNKVSPLKKKRSTTLSPLVVLTNRKLVRRQESSGSHSFKKSPVTGGSTKLIRVNRNKLIHSSLLQKYAKRSSSIQTDSYPAKSVLSQMIQQRRRPYSGSSYVLLTRNKLVRKIRFKNKVWKKQTDSGAKQQVNKKIAVPSKEFVSVGKNKLIRKSLFSKTNKVMSSKQSISSVSPVKNKLFARMFNSPGRRVQIFTNHLSRMNLKYLAASSSCISRNRFSNKCKNNKRILRRKNSVCPVFRRRGECSKKMNNNCSFLHDEKYVAICKNHIKGICDDESCHLSHDLIPQKVPICLHFLNGRCESDRCPFLHKMVEPKAPICAQFLRGYCEAGDKCPNWHVYACPQYKSSAKCDKGDKCRLPHRDSDYFEEKYSDSNDADDENVIPWRYFEKNKLDEKDLTGLQIIPERQSMGILPDYIPF